jgi:predicted dehydrogenase
MYDASKSNGLLAEVNSHDRDSLRWLAGSEIGRVYAEAGNFKCRDVADRWPDYYDNVAVTLRFRNGALGMLDGAMKCEYGCDARMEVLCEKGVLHIGSIIEPGLTVVTIGNGARRDTVKSWRHLFREAYLAEMAEALHNRKIGDAGIDVLPTEPPGAEEAIIRLWLERADPPVNLVITPHSAFYSDAGMVEMRVKAAQEVARVLRGEKPRYGVNAQQLARVPWAA